MAGDQKEPQKKGSSGSSVLNLTNQQKKYLRGLGHALNPLLLVGKEGITEGFLKQLEKVLFDHELVKVKILQNAPMSKEEAEVDLLKKVQATLVQRIGKTFLLYAPHPEEPVIQLPKPRKGKKPKSS